MNPYSNFSMQRLMATHRQWIRADAMRRQFDSLLPAHAPIIRQEHGFETYFISDANSFMYAWYSFLFSVLEATRDGIRKHIDTNLSIEGTEHNLCELLGLDYELFVDWKKLRNATFHIRSDYWDTDIFEAISHDGAGQKIRATHNRVGDLLLEALHARDGQQTTG